MSDGTGQSGVARFVRAALWTTGGIALVGLGAAVGLLLWLNTSHGRDFVLATAVEQIEAQGGQLAFTGVSGGLLENLAIESIRYASAGIEVQAAPMRLHWQPSRLLQGRLHIGAIEIEQVDIVIRPSAQPSAEEASGAALPEALALPLAVEVERVAVGSLTVQTVDTKGLEAGDAVRLHDLGLKLQYPGSGDAKAFALTQIRATTPWGTMKRSAFQIAERQPYAVSATLDWQGPIADQALELTVSIGGDLQNLKVDLNATAGAASAVVVASLQPLAPTLWQSIDARLANVNLKAFSAVAPVTALDANVELRNPASAAPDTDPTSPARRERLIGTISMDNAASGAWPEGDLPLRQVALDVAADYADDPARATLRLDNIRLSLRQQAHGIDSNITGRTTIDLDQRIEIAGQSVPAIDARLEFAAIDLSQWAAGAPQSVLGGSLVATPGALDIDLAQSDEVALVALPILGSGNTPPPKVQVHARVEKNQLIIDAGTIEINGSRIALAGSAGIEPPHALALTGTLSNVDLENWLAPSLREQSALLTGQVNAKWSVKGPVTPQAELQAAVEIFDSALGGQALTMDLKAGVATTTDYAVSRLSAVDARLRLGSNRLTMNGALGTSDDQMSIVATLPVLNSLDPRVAGKLDLTAKLRGAWQSIRASVQANGSRLAFRQDGSSTTLQQLDLDADVPLTTQVAPDTPVDVDAKLRGLKLGETSIDRIGVTVAGSIRAHDYDATASADGWRGRIAGSGSARLDAEPEWQSTLKRLDGDLSGVADAGHRVRVYLQRDANLSASAENVAITDLVLRSSVIATKSEQRRSSSPGKTTAIGKSSANGPVRVGDVTIDRMRIGLGTSRDIDLDAKLDELAIAGLVRMFVDEKAADKLEGLVGNGRIDLKGSQLDDLTGSMTFALGDQSADSKSAAGLGTGEILAVKFSRGALDGKFALDAPDLSTFASLTGPDLALAGSLSLAGSIGGTTRVPEWTAQVRARDLDATQRALGWRLNNGELDARIRSDRVELERFTIDSGEGNLKITGAAKIPHASTPPSSEARFIGRFQINPERFVVPIGPGQRLAVSGRVQLVGEDGGIALTGRLDVDDGIIEIQGSGAPSTPNDLVFVDDRDKSKQSSPAKADVGSEVSNDSRLSINANLEIGLGNQLRIVGSGVRARLAGSVVVAGTLPDDPQVTGRLDIVDGSYRAYGQALNIERGIVRFNGPPTNPVLDIAAMRPNLPVKAGVSVTGTADSPKVQLVSTPEMSEAEKLSWVVLGTKLDKAGGAAQSLALTQAAKGLAGLDTSDEQGGGIAQRLGIDSLGLGYASDTAPQQGVSDSGAPTGLPGGGSGSGESDAQEVVKVGKQLSSKVRVSYERGLSGIQNLLRLQYDISKRLAIRAQTGSDNAVDLLYFFSFD